MEVRVLQGLLKMVDTEVQGASNEVQWGEPHVKQKPSRYGLTCSKGGGTPLQGDREEFDSLWVHKQKIWGDGCVCALDSAGPYLK